MAKTRILSLDGGGLRGLITVRMLQKLSSDPEIRGWLNKVDIIAGTSTGGIIALGLAAGKSLEEIGDLYFTKGKDIFDDSLWDNILDLGKTIGADYSNKNLKKELNKIFGRKKLGTLEKRVVVPAFDLDGKINNKRKWKPKIFHNFDEKDANGQEEDKKQSIVKVALYTSAAPTYFPSVDGYIDGGVFANNPSMVALSQSISDKNTPDHRSNLDDVVLLSVGTGLSLKYIEGDDLDWGYAQWVKPLINILMEGVTGISDYQAGQFLNDRYHRLQIYFGKREKLEMDNAKQIDEMDQKGRGANVNAAKRWIKERWM